MQSVTRTHKEMHMIRPKYGTIGLSYLLSEHLFHIWSIIILYLINGQSLKQILCWVLFQGNDLNILPFWMIRIVDVQGLMEERIDKLKV